MSKPMIVLAAAALVALAAFGRSNEGQAQGQVQGQVQGNAGPPMLQYVTRGAAPAGDRLALGRDGKQLFRHNCGYCHLEGGMGTIILTPQRTGMGEPPQNALIENRSDLTSDYVETVVRQGKGAMPRISRAEVTDPELKSIAAYLGKAKQ